MPDEKKEPNPAHEGLVSCEVLHQIGDVKNGHKPGTKILMNEMDALEYHHLQHVKADKTFIDGVKAAAAFEKAKAEPVNAKAEAKKPEAGKGE